MRTINWRRVWEEPGWVGFWKIMKNKLNFESTCCPAPNWSHTGRLARTDLYPWTQILCNYCKRPRTWTAHVRFADCYAGHSQGALQLRPSSQLQLLWSGAATVLGGLRPDALSAHFTVQSQTLWWVPYNLKTLPQDKWVKSDVEWSRWGPYQVEFFPGHQHSFSLCMSTLYPASSVVPQGPGIHSRLWNPRDSYRNCRLHLGAQFINLF